MAKVSSRRMRPSCRIGRAWFYICVCLFFGAVAVSRAEDFFNPVSIADFQKIVSSSNGMSQSFHIEGTVRAIVRQRKLIALQDRSATILIELPTLDDAVGVGDQVSIEGENCTLIQNRFYTQLGTAPVVDNDGRHPATLRSGTVFLTAGYQPICLEWFNADNPSALNVEWQEPDGQRQHISSAMLWHQLVDASNQPEYEHGLELAAYNGDEWYSLPDFTSLTPVTNLIATHFDLSYRVRPENTALVFNGYIKITKSGLYTFYLNSDDGSLLHVGVPKVSCKVISTVEQSTRPLNLKSFPDSSGDQWGELEGNVIFSTCDQRKLRMDVVVDGIRVPVTIVDGVSLFPLNLLHQQIRVAGIFEYTHGVGRKRLSGIIVPGAEQFKLVSSRNEGNKSASTNNLLTMVSQVRQLKSAEAARHIPVKIKGVVIGLSPERLVLCDSTGGVSVHFNSSLQWAELPQVGERLEIQGDTLPGDFVPAVMCLKMTRLGNAPMPEPVKPTWDEIMDGNLDCEYVEIQGVLTAVTSSNLTLLMRDGKITVDRNDVHPLPQLPHYSGDGALVGSVVRLRGGLNNEWDAAARQVIRGRLYLNNPVMSVESPALQDPFSIPASNIRDLFWYNARPMGIQRIKVEGQVIFVQRGECFALNHNIGFRILTSGPISLQAGDLIEALGFPKLGDASPVLQEAILQKTGHASLPLPVQLSAEELLNQRHDSTLVQVEALLINDTIHPNGRILELRAGQIRFEARLNSDSSLLPSLSIGSKLRLVGVYAAFNTDHFDAKTGSFELLLNSPAAVTVLQMPPWWTVQRALGMAAALAGALGLAVVWAALLRRKVEVRTAQLQKEIEGRNKVERQRVMEQERTRVAQDLHDELGAGLTEMSLLGALAKRPDIPTEEREHYLDQLTKSARLLVTGLDEIVWAINPHYDSIGSIATYYTFFAEEFLNLAGIVCRLQVAESLPEFSLDSQVRHGIFLALKEALTNIVRHSRATEVTLKINMVGNQLTISIFDDGCGFKDGSSKPGSDGLSGMRARLQKLGGVCDISSLPGQGTMIEFRLNLTAAVAQVA